MQPAMPQSVASVKETLPDRQLPFEKKLQAAAHAGGIVRHAKGIDFHLSFGQGIGEARTDMLGKTRPHCHDT